MQRYYKLRSSRSLAFLLFLLCAASLISLWFSPLPGLAALAMTVAVLICGGYCLLHAAYLRRGDSCVAFRLDDREAIVLILRSGRHMPGQLLPDCLVTPYFVILNVVLDEQRGTRSLQIMPDAMGKDSFRHLRIALRWGNKAAQPST